MTIVSDRNNYDTRSQTMSGNQAGRSANRQADRQTDGADPKTQLLVDSQTKLRKIPTLSACRHSGIVTDRQSNRCRRKQTGRQTDLLEYQSHDEAGRQSGW
jgi:hypothetical protein